MSLSRRRFFQHSAALSAAAVAASSFVPSSALAAETDPPSETVDLAQAGVVPPPEIIALNRMGYGPLAGDANTPGSIAYVRRVGLDAYINEQLNPNDADDTEFNQRMAAARLKIRYNADSEGRFPAMNEARPLNLLQASNTDLWQRNANNMGMMNMAWQERNRPWEEVRVATWLRARYSRWQLREILVEFWHNHFNVATGAATEIMATFPEYDRIMRRNCFGNFRQFMEEVGRSVAMMYYLDNMSNRASGGQGGNENYARELFELHALGSDNYVKVNAASPGFEGVGPVAPGSTLARAYTDEDVYQAADAFSGWTIANGQDGRPNTGEFIAFDQWHRFGVKIVLSPTFRPNIVPGTNTIGDGQAVYNMLARHPGTARNICTKLCRRLIGDSPPANVVNAAAAEWLAAVDAPDQIRRVVAVILRSAEFRATWGQKMKRPFEFLMSYMRATGAHLPVDQVEVDGKPEQGGFWGTLIWNFNSAGQRQFEWPTPTGHPDLASYWNNTNSMLRRWNMTGILTQSWGGNVQLDLVGQTNRSQTVTQIVDSWIARLFGYNISGATRQAAIDFLAMGNSATAPPAPAPNPNGEWSGDQNAVPERIVSMVRLLSMSPEFQMR
ncbi:MAG: DUF1800 domain-containing protein [Chloroflexaceae bacterium]|jgi:uncharacterized protein (DUF1800 family)|nr:DUF1800 domain-containing protein [Chloroflexaceae bacterium]